MKANGVVDKILFLISVYEFSRSPHRSNIAQISQ